eukprot:GFUD01031812.1.p1 GENE.GFUD01031812.1~~GFUD01031812.1.p1  ORF type:complete len:103 (+),score=12.84 GFUD01031812.1:549-857(+)
MVLRLGCQLTLSPQHRDVDDPISACRGEGPLLERQIKEKNLLDFSSYIVHVKKDDAPLTGGRRTTGLLPMAFLKLTLLLPRSTKLPACHPEQVQTRLKISRI